MNPIQRFIKKAERWNMIIGGVMLLTGAVLFGFGMRWVSIFLGVIASVGNMWVIARVARALVKRGSSGIPLAIFFGKFALLLLICYVLVVVFEVEAVPFVIGLSSTYVALLVASLLSVGQEEGIEIQE